MRARSYFMAGLVFVLMASPLFSNPVCLAGNVSIDFKVPSFIQVQGGTVSFVLPFSDFSTGAESETAVVEYTVKANNVTREQGVLMAQIGSEDPDLNLQAKFVSFNSQGGNAVLVPSQSGFVTLTTRDVFLADKVANAGSGKTVQGDVGIAYKATALTELAAGTRIMTLKLTFADV